jgi:hypothetical protein
LWSFNAGVKNSRVVELHDSNHYVFIRDEALVVRDTTASLPGRVLESAIA